jgi:hypothetical protein
MRRRIAHAAQIGAIVLALVLVPAALAAKGGASHGGGGGNHGGGGSTSGGVTIALAPPGSSDGLAHFGMNVTFNVYTTATSSPYVELDCYQGGALVYMNAKGFFPSYPWGQIFTLSSGAWTGGAANCTATLYAMNASGTTRTDLASTKFDVYP